MEINFGVVTYVYVTWPKLAIFDQVISAAHCRDGVWRLAFTDNEGVFSLGLQRLFSRPNGHFIVNPLACNPALSSFIDWTEFDSCNDCDF